jgi:hypothetical protein
MLPRFAPKLDRRKFNDLLRAYLMPIVKTPAGVFFGLVTDVVFTLTHLLATPSSAGRGLCNGFLVRRVSLSGSRR